MTLYACILLVLATAHSQDSTDLLVDREGARALAVTYGKGLVRKSPQMKQYAPLMVDAAVTLKERVWFCQMGPKSGPKKPGTDEFITFFMIALSADSGTFLGATFSADLPQWQRQMISLAQKVENQFFAKPKAGKR